MKKAQPDSNEQLLDTITALKEEVHVLRDTVDELRSELQWLCNNAHECNVAPTPSSTQRTRDATVRACFSVAGPFCRALATPSRRAC